MWDVPIFDFSTPLYRRLRESTVLVHTYLRTLKTNPLYTSVEMCKVGFLAKLPDNPLYTKQSPDNPLYTPTLHINIIIVVEAKKPSPPCTPFFNILTPPLDRSARRRRSSFVVCHRYRWNDRTGPKSLVDAVNWIRTAPSCFHSTI